jgi:hypothetical protein
MKPIDLQVNILKSLDMVSEKARDAALLNQLGHLEDESKKERQVKDFHVPVNREAEDTKGKLPEHLPERRKSSEKDTYEHEESSGKKKSQEEESKPDYYQHAEEQITQQTSFNKEETEKKIGDHLDLKG